MRFFLFVINSPGMGNKGDGMVSLNSLFEYSNENNFVFKCKSVASAYINYFIEML